MLVTFLTSAFYVANMCEGLTLRLILPRSKSVSPGTKHFPLGTRHYTSMTLRQVLVHSPRRYREQLLRAQNRSWLNSTLTLDASVLDSERMPHRTSCGASGGFSRVAILHYLCAFRTNEPRRLLHRRMGGLTPMRRRWTAHSGMRRRHEGAGSQWRRAGAGQSRANTVSGLFVVVQRTCYTTARKSRKHQDWRHRSRYIAALGLLLTYLQGSSRCIFSTTRVPQNLHETRSCAALDASPRDGPATPRATSDNSSNFGRLRPAAWLRDRCNHRRSHLRRDGDFRRQSWPLDRRRSKLTAGLALAILAPPLSDATKRRDPSKQGLKTARGSFKLRWTGK